MLRALQGARYLCGDIALAASYSEMCAQVPCGLRVEVDIVN